MDDVAAWICSMGMDNSMVEVVRRMGIQNFPVPFPIRSRIGGSFSLGLLLAFSQGGRQVVFSLLQARLLPCGAGLEIPLFHEPASANTILCNVAITIFGQYVLMFLFQWRIYGNVPSRRHHFTSKKAREKIPIIYPRASEGLRPFPKL